MRRAHLVTGGVTLAAFLLSGMYMRSLEPPADQGTLLLFVSRHLYVLSASLINLLLGIYVAPAPERGRQITQRLGSVLVLAAAGMLAAAFIIEPVAGRGRTAVSAFGWFALFGGSLLHVIAGIGRHVLPDRR